MIGVFLIALCTAAGSASDVISETDALNPSTLIEMPVRAVNGAPHQIVAHVKGAPRHDWLRAAFADTAEAAVPDVDADTFGEMLSEVKDPSYVYSEEEKAFVARVVYAEARGEGFEGKVAVAAVVLNRFESGRFGGTVKRVVFARRQFAVSGRYNDECMAAVNVAIDQDNAFPDDMYYFRVSQSKKWRNFDYYGRIGNHSFYCA